MRLRYGISVIVVALGVVVGACSEQRLTAPQPERYITTSTMSVMNPKTHQLEPVNINPATSGISASYVGGGTDNAVLIASGAPGIATTAGHISTSYVDTAGHAHKVIFLYRVGGGPPAAVQHWRDAVLISTTAFSWAHISTGWYMSQSLTRMLSQGTVLGQYSLASTYTQTTVPCSRTVTTNCVPAGTVMGKPRISPLRRVLGYAALGLANACAPADALAQAGFHFYDCGTEWLIYFAAMTALYGAAGTAPDGGVIVLAGMYAGAVAALKQLVDCMVAADNRASGGFGSAGAGAGGAAETTADCDNGGYGGNCPMAYVE
jgi:hypothetical protein